MSSLNCNVSVYSYCPGTKDSTPNIALKSLLNFSKSNLKLKQQLNFHKNNGSDSLGIIGL
jgi:hypothetical protein